LFAFFIAPSIAIRTLDELSKVAGVTRELNEKSTNKLSDVWGGTFEQTP
jgi:hypothetical protein